MLTLSPDGSLKYQPGTHFSGVDTFSYQVTDGALTSSIVTVRIDVMQLAGPNSGGSSGGSGTTNRDATVDNSTTDATTGQGAPVAALLANSDVGRNAAGSRLSGGRGGNSSEPSAEEFNETTADNWDDANSLESLLLSGTVSGGPQLFGINGGDRNPSAQRAMTNLLGGTLPAIGRYDTIVTSGFFSLSKAAPATSSETSSDPSVLADNVVVGSTAVVTTSLSVGYVIWLLRGGSLLTAFMSAMPTWQSFDPLPVLQSFEKSTDDDDESLLGIVTKKTASRLRKLKNSQTPDISVGDQVSR
jgi:hypothetical protein